MSDRYYKINKKILFAILYIFIFIIKNKFVYAEDSLSSPLVSDSEYIYFDLYCGSVTISSGSYTGYVIENGVITQKTGTVDRKIYIYQSNGDKTVWKDGLPSYSGVGAPSSSGKNNWGDYITNNTNINAIITDWETQATAVSRAETEYCISITGKGTYDITIDNIWSNFQKANTARRDGGFSFYPNDSTASKVTILFKGDNRFGNIFYGTNSNKNHNIIFKGIDNATLTVANLRKKDGYNHYNSAIGGSDSSGGDSIGMIFESGIIYAGTTLSDNCTAIGGGGNAKGDVIINGGTITAVSNSTGTAIGGGIGYSSFGGDANVTINGGTIFAYNFGYAAIPSAAIGGGSSYSTNGNANTTVTITGGEIFAVLCQVLGCKFQKLIRISKLG